jgi:hypothetical protein
MTQLLKKPSCDRGASPRLERQVFCFNSLFCFLCFFAARNGNPSSHDSFPHHHHLEMTHALLRLLVVAAATTAVLGSYYPGVPGSVYYSHGQVKVRVEGEFWRWMIR